MTHSILYWSPRTAHSPLASQLLSVCAGGTRKGNRISSPSKTWHFLEQIGGVPCFFEVLSSSPASCRLSITVCLSHPRKYRRIECEADIPSRWILQTQSFQSLLLGAMEWALISAEGEKEGWGEKRKNCAPCLYCGRSSLISDTSGGEEGKSEAGTNSGHQDNNHNSIKRLLTYSVTQGGKMNSSSQRGLSQRSLIEACVCMCV